MHSSSSDRVIWSGVYSSFLDVKGDEGLSESENWVDTQLTQMSGALERLNTTESIPELAQTQDYVLFSFVASMLAHRNNFPVRILDFGGGLASTYLPLIAMLPDGAIIEYVIVENAEICEEGNKLFVSDKRIIFRTDIPESEKFDIVHAGSSMHYIDDWIGCLKILSSLEAAYLIFADLPAGDIETFVTTQHYYGRKIPVRFWNVNEFISSVQQFGYKLVIKSRFKGDYLSAMHLFDEKHRLKYFSPIGFQLIKVFVLKKGRSK